MASEGKSNIGLAAGSDEGKVSVTYKLRDTNSAMVAAWENAFKNFPDRVEVSHGDIFRGGPTADAIVSPANSFGFMDGGIDMAYSRHFGWQLQKRLQEIIRREHHGELLVGDAIILPTFEGGAKPDSMKWEGYNEDIPINYLISAPTMRVPMEVTDTANAYSAFRAVILAVKKHNAAQENEPIRSVLCPGLGTSVGGMPPTRCAFQMLHAFETFEQDRHPDLISPDKLETVWLDHIEMTEHEEGEKKSSKAGKGK